jgi:hypothetical protein
MFFKPRNGVEIIIFSFEPSIRAEVVTFRLDVAIGSLHTQQLHGFDSMNCATIKGSFGVAVRRLTKQLHHFICPNHAKVFEFFD